MKIVGIIEYKNTYENNWNGETIRYSGSGSSGTDQSFILVAEYIASKGHEVYLSFSNILDNTTYNGVNYISKNTLINISNEIDILIIPSWNYDFFSFSWLSLKKLVIWCHYQGYISESYINLFKAQYSQCKIYTNILSNFVKIYLDKYHPYYLDISDQIFQIDNPLMMDLFVDDNYKKDPHSFIFFATFERGGEIALNAYKSISYSDKKIYYSNHTEYEKHTFPGNLIDMIPLKWSDKQSVFNLLKKIEYFIYPLVLPLERHSIIHKDTDGCVVAESLLHEVIVLTYPVGALKEKYGDHLVYLPYPPGVDINLLEGPDQVSAPQFHSEFVIDSIVKTIEFLENNPQLKEVLKKRGKDYILKERDSDFIKSEWLNNLGLNN
jgi:hypothetical protein